MDKTPSSATGVDAGALGGGGSSSNGSSGDNNGASSASNGATDAGSVNGSDGGKPVVRTAQATLVIHDTSRLSIGQILPEFAYKGGENKGTLMDHGDGTASVFFPAMGNSVTPLEVIPGGLGEVQIEPNDMTGEIDFCTGIMNMPFDAQFTPVIFGMKNTKMHVVTDLTTEESKGMSHTLVGKRLDLQTGDLKLVGVAVVPATMDITVDGLLQLPNDAVTNMDGTLMVEGGFPACPTATK